MEKQLVINIKTVLFIAGLILAGFFLYRVFPLILLIYTALLAALVLEPSVQYFSKQILFNRPLNRVTAVLISYFLLVLVLVGIFALILPGLVSQLQLLMLVKLPYLDQTIGQFLFGNSSVELSSYFGNVVQLTASVFEGFLTIFLGIAISIYLSMQWLDIKSHISRLPLGKYRNAILGAIDDIEASLGGWAKGQIILMLVVGLSTTVGLLLLGGGTYAIALGLLAGLLEFIPLVGPIVTAIIAVVIYYPTSPILAGAVVALFVIIQQLESNLLVPKVMQRISGFNPLLILLAVTLGQHFYGAVGVLIAVPTFMIGVILFHRLSPYFLSAKESE